MAAIKWPVTSLGAILSELEAHYGNPEMPQFNGPFEMILWEMVGYLADDERRTAAFSGLRDKVGLTPANVVAASKGVLVAIARSGGAIAAEERAGRMRMAAELALEHDLAQILRELPLREAKRMLLRFPMIGEPGAEKILLFCGVLPVLALESNGLRTLTRLGFGETCRSYSATYKSVRAATANELPGECRLLTKAHLLLRRHGQDTCKSNNPACRDCVVRSHCRYYGAGRPKMEV